MTPAGRGQPALEVLPGRDKQAFPSDLLQITESKLAQAVPLFGLREERLRPDVAVAHRFGIAGRVVVGAYPFHDVLVPWTADSPAALPRRAGRLQRAGVAGFRRCPVAHDLPLGHPTKPRERLPLRAALLVVLSVVGETVGAVQG